MTDSENSRGASKLEELKILSEIYAAQQTKSARFAIVANIGTAVVGLIVASGVVFAWRYYGSAIEEVERARASAREASTVVSELRGETESLRAEIDRIRSSTIVPVGNPDLSGNVLPVGELNSATTPSWGAAGRLVQPVMCREGQVAVGVELTVGGTCNRACDPDGRPIQQFKVVCRNMQLAK
jgi:hypothetical protein